MKAIETRGTDYEPAMQARHRKVRDLEKKCLAMALKSSAAFNAQGHTSGQLAVNEVGTLVHISSSPKGLACGLHCPVCNEQVIAKKGNVNTHHFSHTADTSCAGLGGEGAVHRWVKNVLINRFDKNGILSPDDLMHLCGQVAYDSKLGVHSLLFDESSWTESVYYGRSLSLMPIELPITEERKANGLFVADIGTRGWGTLTASIEVVVTHAPDADRINKAIDCRDGIYTVEAGHISTTMTEQEVWSALKGSMKVIYPGWIDLNELSDHGFDVKVLRHGMVCFDL
jgi:hypothetical protein